MTATLLLTIWASLLTLRCMTSKSLTAGLPVEGAARWLLYAERSGIGLGFAFAAFNMAWPTIIAWFLVFLAWPARLVWFGRRQGAWPALRLVLRVPVNITLMLLRGAGRLLVMVAPFAWNFLTAFVEALPEAIAETVSKPKPRLGGFNYTTGDYDMDYGWRKDEEGNYHSGFPTLY